MEIINDVYRTQSGQYLFEFNFVNKGSYFEIDIVDQPGYGNRNSGEHPTHRLPSDRGGYRICFGNPETINTLDKAFEWAAVWSEQTEKYIVQGIDFNNN